jgi:hypothetical protein
MRDLPPVPDQTFREWWRSRTSAGAKSAASAGEGVL